MSRDSRASNRSGLQQQRDRRPNRQAGKSDVLADLRQANLLAVPRVYYERHLPHQVPPGYPIFLTWNLKGSLPQRAIHELEQERQRLEREAKRPDESQRERSVRQGKILFAKRDRCLDAECKAHRLASLIGEEKTWEETAVRLENLTYKERPMWLADPRAARKVVDSFLWGVPQRYELFSFAVLAIMLMYCSLRTPIWRSSPKA